MRSSYALSAGKNALAALYLKTFFIAYSNSSFSNARFHWARAGQLLMGLFVQRPEPNSCLGSLRGSYSSRNARLAQ
jgi:hypothetical protein